MTSKSERLGRRKKPLRRSASSLLERPIQIAPEDGPVFIDAEHKGGRRVVRITPGCPPGCQCGGAQCETNLTSTPPED